MQAFYLTIAAAPSCVFTEQHFAVVNTFVHFIAQKLNIKRIKFKYNHHSDMMIKTYIYKHVFIYYFFFTEVTMTFLDSIKTCLKKTLTISGRASRSEFWWFQLSFFVIGLIGALLVSAFGLDSTISSLICFLLGIYGLVGGIASFTAGIRRLHDTNRSGWLVLVFWLLGLIPFVNFISWIVYIVFICQAGTQGDNRFGAQPE